MPDRERRIQLEIRRRGSVVTFQEVNPPSSDDWDPGNRNSIVAAASRCMKCPIKDVCSPVFRIAPWGISRNLALVIQGNNLNDRECLIPKKPLISHGLGPDKSRQLLNSLTSEREANKQEYSLRLPIT